MRWEWVKGLFRNSALTLRSPHVTDNREKRRVEERLLKLQLDLLNQERRRQGHPPVQTQP